MLVGLLITKYGLSGGTPAYISNLYAYMVYYLPMRTLSIRIYLA